jgi:LysM repeat protein
LTILSILEKLSPVMRVLATALIAFLGPVSLLAEGRSELDILRARSTEQERQIRTLETEIESLHSQLALERRRSRGIEQSAPSITTPSAKRANYTVRTGDTLSSIARCYHISAEGLMTNNGIADPTRLRVGQKLILPSDAKDLRLPPPPVPKAEQERPNPKPTPKPPANTHNYQVQRGDTLYGIARRHQISINSLKKLNPTIDDKIVTGQTITVTGQPKKLTLISTKSKTIAIREGKASSKVRKKTPNTSAPKTTPHQKTDPPKPKPQVDDNGKTKVIPPTPKSISSILVMEEISFGNFAKNHGTTPDQLNSLNGWTFKPSLVLARGSEIYVPVP